MSLFFQYSIKSNNQFVKQLVRYYVARESLPTFRKLVSGVPTFQGTWELVGNFPNPAETVPDGNFYPLKSETDDRHISC